jgi:Protein of unknown function (DUF3363)
LILVRSRFDSASFAPRPPAKQSRHRQVDFSQTTTYCQRVTLTSGRFAMIDNGVGVALLLWAPEIDRHLGRHVAGVARESGGIEWSFGRKRGLEVIRDRGEIDADLSIFQTSSGMPAPQLSGETFTVAALAHRQAMFAKDDAPVR